MKPHMEHIAETLVRKEAADAARNTTTAYAKYREKAEKAMTAGYTVPEIVSALEAEIKRIEQDHRPGDPLFLHGVNNAKFACISSISVLICELKGEKEHGQLPG